MTDSISRRKFLITAGEVSLVAAGATVLAKAGVAQAVPATTRVDDLPFGVTRTWLGPEYWANRLMDWRLNNGRIECLTAARRAGHTVAVLPREIVAGDVSGTLSVRTGTLASGTGFSGFLIGAGAGSLHWKAAALVMSASGQGGGILATYDSDGNVRFREHTSETNQFAYAELPATARSGPAPVRTTGEDVVLTLEINSTGTARFDLRLTARSLATGTLLSQATRTNVADAAILGGISLISSPRSGGTSSRHWFRELMTGGEKIAHRERAAGPILGAMYSLSGNVLKLSAQFMPIGVSDAQTAVLQRRRPGALDWIDVATEIVGQGYVALFRVADWPSDEDWEFRVGWALGTSQEAFYAGSIRQDPADASNLTIAMVNCTIHSFRNLTATSSGTPTLPGEVFRGLYTSENLYFPYAEMVANIERHAPDMLVAFGDQFYENRPTGTDTSQPLLDMLFRYYLWLWSFEDITRNTPTVCLVDDHDVYHGNLWGWSGRAAPNGSYSWGGYIMPPDWVNAVQRVQCAHNPDAYDPTPVLQGITVYYTAFSYGGVSFALLEDRKFKNTNKTNRNPDGSTLTLPRDLLGERQESFLREWKDMHPGQPKVVLTQTVFATASTNQYGARQSDPDSNGAPVPARRMSLNLIKDAGAVMLSGDQHVSTLIRHGITTYTDGPVQFTAPAGGTAWQRWFDPASALPNARGDNTGDWVDGYGNRFRVLAVANPKISFAELRAVKPSGNEVGDRNLKSEGYGITRVDKAGGAFRFEAWRWDTDPAVPGHTPFPGWPYELSFSDA